MASDVLGPSWNISEKGREIITENNTINDKSRILKNALNADLKEIGSPIIHKILSKNNATQVVLQIQKIPNISAPKANENSHVAPRMLKLVLTDGDTYIQAIETAPIPSLSQDKTPPGVKLLINSAKISSGYILLNSNNCSLLGGKVPALYEKWELAKSVQYHNRQHSSNDGPPAWVNFGCKIQSDIQDKSFKSLDNKNQEIKENTKFDLQRQDAIAEATSGAVKKVFGGGVKQPVQAANYQKNKKPIDSAIREKKNQKNKNNNINIKDVEDKPQKPLERVSLFDFLEDKLPPSETVNNVASEPVKPSANNNNNFNPKNVQNYQNNKARQQNPKPTYNKTELYQNNSFRGRSETKPQNNSFRRNDFKPQNSDQNNSFRGHTEVKPQVPQNNIEVNGLSDGFGKMSLNSQFASRSLKQHLNLGPQKQNTVDNSNEVQWKVGDDCVAKYWEDGKFYNATITAITDRTCVVKFKGYGNIEEVLKTDCLPVVGSQNKKQYTGPTEFRRNTRTYRRQ